MEAFLSLLLALSSFARSAGPYYPLPTGTTFLPETCTILEEVKGASGAWKTESRIIHLRTAYWSEGEAFVTLTQAPGTVTYTRTLETFLGGIRYHRSEVETDWAKPKDKWTATQHKVEIDLQNADDGSAVLTETRDGGNPQTWDVRSFAEGNPSINQRLARDPAAFNTDGREVRKHVETCRLTLGPSFSQYARVLSLVFPEAGF